MFEFGLQYNSWIWGHLLLISLAMVVRAMLIFGAFLILGMVFVLSNDHFFSTSILVNSIFCLHCNEFSVLWFQGCCGGLHFSDVLMLNLDTMSWNILASTGQGPGPRDSHSAVLVGRQMFVFGGTNGSKKVNDLHVLDLVTKEWIRPECKGTPPCPRESHTATLIGDDRIMIFGGSGEGEANYLNDLHILDLKTMRWSSPEVKGDIPVPRDSHGAVTVGKGLFVYGGDCGDRYHGDVDVLDTDTLTWTKVLSINLSLLSILVECPKS